MPLRVVQLAIIEAALGLAGGGPASANSPLGYLTAAGPKSQTVLPLTWTLLGLSVAVVLVMSALVLWGIWRRAPESTPESSIGRGPGGLALIRAGIAATVVALFASVVGTMIVLADVSKPATKPALTIDVTAKQWWWDVRYEPTEPDLTFTTANEIHIPVGKSVAINLRSSDVIHSFWVPALSGKMDAVPGQVNTTWIEASKPGTYLGQCSEFCGTQHARMGFRIVAETEKAFSAWCQAQLQPAHSADGNPSLVEGQTKFMQRCAACHALRGTDAGGVYGPDLTHLMTRKTLAAGTVPNSPGYLSAWIADPQGIKPGTRMPSVDLSGPDLQAIRTYLAAQN